VEERLPEENDYNRIIAFSDKDGVRECKYADCGHI
jgi:hypothetical protein